MSRSVEILHVRCNAPDVELVTTALRELLAALAGSGARVYRSTTVPNDLSVHLARGDGRSLHQGPSDIAIRIADALRDFGQVHHTTWTELPSDQQNEGTES